MTPKLTLAGLMVELTRRCNLACSHCSRGNAENLDLSREKIDSLLDTTNGFYTIHLSGGEPFLSIDTMRYLIDGIKRRGSYLGGLSIISNGTVRDDSVVDVIREYSEYIRTCIKPDIDIRSVVSVSVSIDSFHETDSERGFQWYKDRLSKYANVGRARAGELPKAVGRAKDLPYATPTNKIAPKKIEYIAPGHEPLCNVRKYYWSFFPKQVTILCGLYLTAKGAVIDSDYIDSSFEEIDKVEPVFSLPVSSPDEIMASIERYNEGKPYCIEPLERKDSPSIDVDRILQTHPDPLAAFKSLKAHLLMMDSLEYQLFFGERSKVSTEELDYLNLYDPKFSEELTETLSDKKLTKSEETCMLCEAISREYNISNYGEQIIEIENKIRQTALEKARAKFIDLVKEHCTDGELSTVKSSLEQLTVGEVEPLTAHEVKELCVDLALMDTVKKLSEKYSSFINSSSERTEQTIERITDSKADTVIDNIIKAAKSPANNNSQKAALNIFNLYLAIRDILSQKRR